MYKNSSYFTIRLIWFYLILGELLSDKNIRLEKPVRICTKIFCFCTNFQKISAGF